MKRFQKPMFLSAVVICAASCGYVAPYTSSGPSLSKEGVEIAIAGERMVMHPRKSEAISLQPGETQTISLNFEQSGELDCHHDLALEAGGAVEIEGGKVSFEPIRFLASR
jgi:hypothetical protein